MIRLPLSMRKSLYASNGVTGQLYAFVEGFPGLDSHVEQSL